MNRLISEAMKDEKYSVDSCFDGRDALDYALAVDYDVIILDVNLPKMDGFAVVKVMARKYTGNKTDEYSIADLTVDTSARTVVRAGETIELTSKEFALLEYMIRNRGVVLSREMIEDNLWNLGEMSQQLEEI